MTNPQCIHIPDGSVVVSGELFDFACAAIGERDKLFAEISQLRGNLSLAEGGLASATQEIERLNDYIKGLPDEPGACPLCLGERHVVIGRMGVSLDSRAPSRQMYYVDEPCPMCAPLIRRARSEQPSLVATKISEQSLTHQIPSARGDIAGSGPPNGPSATEPPEQLYRLVPLSLDNAETQAREASSCEHLRSERLGTKSAADGEPLFEMRKCLDCTKIFRKRLTVKDREILCEAHKIDCCTACFGPTPQKSVEQLVPAGHEQVATPEGDRGPSEYCGNWPCRLPRYHTGPCNSSPSQRT